MTVSAAKILELLCKRHAEHIFIPECNIGSTAEQVSGRLDAWAIKRAYINKMSWGYEIKVSRADFLNDDKWPKYLDCCSQFYFVCPPGLIDKDEVSEEVGLIYVAKSGNRLIRKKKAKTRNIEHPESFLLSILFNRTSIVTGRPETQSKEDRIEAYKQYLRYRKGIDRIVKHKIRKTIKDLNSRAETAERKAKNLQDVKDLLDSRDISVDNYFNVVSSVENELVGNTELVKSLVSLNYPLESALNTINNLKDQVSSVKEKIGNSG